MKVEFDKKTYDVKFIPECDMDVWNLARAFEKIKGTSGMGSIGGKVSYISFRATDLLNAINRGKNAGKDRE